MKSRFNGGLRHGAAACALVLLAACGGGGGGGSTPPPAPPAPVIPDPVVRLSASATQLYAGEYAQFTGGDLQAGVTWRWEFSDGTSADGLSVERRFAQTGSFTVTAIAQNSAGTTARASTTVQVQAQPAPVARAAGSLTLEPGCSGLHCAAAADGRYSGSGVGVWRMRIAGATSQLVDVDIANVQAGQPVTLVFSNGETKDATELPKGGSAVAASLGASPGVRIQAAQALDTAAEEMRHDARHARLLGQMRQQWLDDLRDEQRRPQAPSGSERRRRALAATDVGSTRVWNDLYDDETKPVPFTAAVLSTCTTGTGRRLVFWVDQELTTAHTVEAAQVEPLKRSFCGDQGGFARAIALLGDVWGGTEVAKRPWLIQEAAGQLQDVNIVVTNHLGSDNSVAGYFYGLNNSYRWRSSRYANSNEALAFFMSGSGLASNPGFYTSTLVHELTHMVNYHQRSIQRGVAHDDWLEEMSAMATEDLLAETTTPGINKIVGTRLPSYLRSGGITSLLDWLDGTAGSSNYSAGGSLAAFLSRRYGSSWTRQLVTDCGNDSYACLDMLLKGAGSAGLADEWERMGTSVFGGMPQRHAPVGYGFPQVQWEGFWLMGADTAQQGGTRKVAPVNAVTRFGGTSHTYLDDQVPAGATRYQRRGVRVPAGTVLTVVVR